VYSHSHRNTSHSIPGHWQGFRGVRAEYVSGHYDSGATASSLKFNQLGRAWCSADAVCASQGGRPPPVQAHVPTSGAASRGCGVGPSVSRAWQQRRCLVPAHPPLSPCSIAATGQ
jgi:hypothetical protein